KPAACPSPSRIPTFGQLSRASSKINPEPPPRLAPISARTGWARCEAHSPRRLQPPAACKKLSTKLAANGSGRSRSMHDLNRRLAEGFYRALASRDAGRIAAYLSDDIDWMSIG